MAASHFLTGTHHGATHRQFKECTIHPGHEKFMTVDEFLNKKPPEIGLTDWDMSYVRNRIARTVRVVVHHTSVDRPDTFINSENPYPCKDIRGHYDKIRYGTGYLFGRCNVADDDNGNDDDNNDNGFVYDHNDDDGNNNGDGDDNDDIDDNNGNCYCDDFDDDDDCNNGNNDDDKDNNNDDNNDDICNGDCDTDDNDNGNDDNNDVPFYVKIPCPCPYCKTPTCQTPNRKSYYFTIRTATHVIFDEQEAQKARFELFYDSEDRRDVVMLYGVTVLDTRHLRWQTGCCTIVCVTHDGSLAEKLGGLCKEEYDDCLWMDRVLVSHPHGVSKRISVGDVPDTIIVVIPNKESVQLKKDTEIRFPACHDYTRIVEDINRLLDKRVISRKWPSNSLVLDCDLKVFRPEGVVMETEWDDYFEYKDGERIRKNKVWCNVFHPGTQLVTDDGKRYTFPYNDDKVPSIEMEVFVKTKYFINKKDKGTHSVFLYRRYNMASCPGSSGAPVGSYGYVHFGNCGDFSTSSLWCIHKPDGDEQGYKTMHVMGAGWCEDDSAFVYKRYNMATCPRGSGAKKNPHLLSISKSETGHTHFGSSGDCNASSLVCVIAYDLIIGVDINSNPSNNFIKPSQYNSMIPAPVENQVNYPKAKLPPNQIHGIPWRFMNNERYRLMSFVKFPIDSPVSTILLSSKGFAYLTDESDQWIVCCFCTTKLKTFNDMTRIDEEHERLGLDCPMVKGTHSNNISMEQQCPHMNAYDIFSKLLASRQNESQVEQPHPSAAAPSSQDDNSDEVTSSQPSDESAPYILVTNFSDIAESDSQVRNPGLSMQHSQILEDPASSQDQEAATSQFSSVPQSSRTDNSETVQSSSAMENSGEQQNSSQQEQPIDSTNAADENAGDANSYEKLGIITARPKRVEYGIYETRLESFNGWPKDHHMKPEDLAKAGYFYTGYSDCARCFYCGGGLRNWEEEDNVWVEHAHWFPKCAYLLQEVGKDFIDTVQVISKDRDKITFDDVIKKMPSGVPAPFRLKEKSIERDPAVLTVIGNGFDKDQIIKLAQEIRKSGELISSDTLYMAAKARNLPKKEYGNNLGSDSVSIRKGGDEKRDKETIETLRNENNELRQQTVCKICMDKEVAVTFLPCGHLVSCSECSCALTACPVCRLSIKGIVRAYVG